MQTLSSVSKLGCRPAYKHSYHKFQVIAKSGTQLEQAKAHGIRSNEHVQFIGRCACMRLTLTRVDKVR